MKFILLTILFIVTLALTPLSAVLIMMSANTFHEEAKWACSLFVCIIGATIAAQLIESIAKKTS